MPILLSLYVVLMRVVLMRVRRARPRRIDERGQSSVEYAFVILVAAVIGSLAIAWAGKTGAIGDLFDSMMSLVKGKAG